MTADVEKAYLQIDVDEKHCINGITVQQKITQLI